MTTLTDTVSTDLTGEAIADLAVAALRAEADLTPKPGLVDLRGPGAHADMDRDLLIASAEALRPAFVGCASAAADLPLGQSLRARIGRIGRIGERDMLVATAGVNTHRGALWALGLLSAATGAGHRDHRTIAEYAGELARIPDPDATAAFRSHGALARVRHGSAGATGEAQSGFPHVRRGALPALWAARAGGADEASARLDALLALMAQLEDTCVLHRGGAAGLRALQLGARSVLDVGGCRTAAGRSRLSDLDDLCATRRLSPGGSGDLLAAALFLDAVEQRT